PEVKQLGEEPRLKPLVVRGYVKEGSIVRAGQSTTFMLVEHEGKPDLGDSLAVSYIGEDPLPATLKDRAPAFADGSLGVDGVFYANKIVAGRHGRTVTVAGLRGMDGSAKGMFLTVHGYIRGDSLEHRGAATNFALVDDRGAKASGDALKVSYV